MRVALGLQSCTATRKLEPGTPGLEMTTGMTPAGFVPEVPVADPNAITARVLLAAEVPEEMATLVAMSPENATRPDGPPGLNPVGLPQLATRAIPTRSPACTATGGVRATVCVVPLTSNGPRSATKNRASPERRKNLILTVPAHGAEDQTNVADVMVPFPVEGNERSTAVRRTGEGLKPKFGKTGRLPAVMVSARAMPPPIPRNTRAVTAPPRNFRMRVLHEGETDRIRTATHHAARFMPDLSASRCQCRP